MIQQRWHLTVNGSRHSSHATEGDACYQRSADGLTRKSRPGLQRVFYEPCWRKGSVSI
jgi:hypothetical protein